MIRVDEITNIFFSFQDDNTTTLQQICEDRQKCHGCKLYPCDCQGIRDRRIQALRQSITANYQRGAEWDTKVAQWNRAMEKKKKH